MRVIGRLGLNEVSPVLKVRAPLLRPVVTACLRRLFLGSLMLSCSISLKETEGPFWGEAMSGGNGISGGEATTSCGLGGAVSEVHPVVISKGANIPINSRLDMVWVGRIMMIQND